VPTINAIFQPSSGALSQYLRNLGGVLVRQGPIYLPNPSSPSKVAPDVISFVNRVMATQQSLYPSRSPPLQFAHVFRLS
jgi:hypothetical protein